MGGGGVVLFFNCLGILDQDCRCYRFNAHILLTSTQKVPFYSGYTVNVDFLLNIYNASIPLQFFKNETNKKQSRQGVDPCKVGTMHKV